MGKKKSATAQVTAKSRYVKYSEPTEREKQVILDMDKMPATAHVRARVAAGYKGISVPTLWRHARQGLIAKPHKSGGTTYWIVGELRGQQ